MAFFADMSGMDVFWPIDEVSHASDGAAQCGAAACPSGAETDASLLTQIEQFLVEGIEPDTAFFVDSWTVGVAAASENLKRRNQGLKNRDCEISAWATFSSFASWSFVGVEASVGAAWPLREGRAAESPTEDLRWFGDRGRNDWQAADEVEGGCSPTFESACQVLGVEATSTREQIRAAYWKMARRHHPDRLAGGGAREKKLASDRMATINEAYRLLCTGSTG